MPKVKDPVQTARNRLKRAGTARAGLLAKIETNREECTAAARAAKAAGIPVAEIADTLGITRQTVHAATRHLGAAAGPPRVEVTPGARLMVDIRKVGSALHVWDVQHGTDLVVSGRSSFLRDVERDARAAVEAACGHPEFSLDYHK